MRFFDNLAAYDNGEGTPAETQSFIYDAFGRQITVEKTTADGTEAREWQFDSQGRLVRIESPEGIVAYDYDVFGRQTKVTVGELASPSSETRYRYDALGRLEFVDVVKINGVNVDDDSTNAGYQPQTNHYQYDLLGNLDRTDLANGVIQKYQYDILNRLDIQTTYAPDASPHDLSDNAKLAQFDYEVRGDGRREGVVEDFWVSDDGVTVKVRNTINWNYDNLNRLIDEVFVTDADEILGNHRSSVTIADRGRTIVINTRMTLWGTD